MLKVQGDAAQFAAGFVEVAGLETLAKELTFQAKAARVAQDKADIHGLEIGRLIVEFSRRGDIEAQIALANAKESKPQGGRPQAPHCWVAERVVVHACTTTSP
jgi:hypothetical protein